MNIPFSKRVLLGGALGLATLTSGLLTVSASDAIISVNISTGAAGNTAVDGEETFGVAAEETVVGNWNNIRPFSNQAGLRRDDGTNSGVEAVSRNGGGEQFWGADYINTPWNYGVAHWPGTQGPVTVQLNNLAAEYPAGYYAIVYVGGAPANSGAAISDGTTTYFFQTPNPRDLTPMQTTDTEDDGVYPVANYAVFGSSEAPLTADSITFRIPTGSVVGTQAGIGGVQVIGFPNDFVDLPFTTRFGSLRYIETSDNLLYALGAFGLEAIEEGDSLFGDKPAIVRDRSGNGRDGFPSATGVAAVSGDSPALVTGSTSSVELPGGVGIDAVGYTGVSGTNPRSVAGWVNPATVEGGKVIAEWGSSAAGTRWTVRLDGARLRTEVQDGFAIGETEMPAGEWSHVAVTFDGADVLDVNLYVNGVKQTFFGSSGIAINTGDVATVRLGAVAPGAFSGSGAFVGALDEIGIWSRALTEQEVANLAGGAAVSDLATDLALYYDFETELDGVITSLPAELSGNLGFKLQSSSPDFPLADVSPYLGFVVDRPTTVYLAYDAAATVPSWISNGYTLTAMTVGTTEGIFNLWERNLAAREQVAMLFDRTAWDPADNAAWVILSEGPDAITPRADDLFIRSAAAEGDWTLDPHHWTLTTAPDSPLHTATMLSNVTNLIPEQGFSLAGEIRVSRLQDAGDNAIGLSLLGEGDEAIRGEWLPNEAGGGSRLQLVDAAGQVLGEAPWTGLAPGAIDNNAGLADGANEVVYAVGAPVFATGENLLDEDFAGGGAGWSSGTDNATPNQWEIGVPTTGPLSAFVGQNVAATNLDGIYSTFTDSWLRSPVVDLTAVAGATLRFREFLDIDTEIFQGDFAHFVTLSVIDVDAVPETSTEIAKYSEMIGEWTLREFDLSAFAGSRIAFEFRFVSDEFQFNNFEGWYLDEIQVIPGAAISRIASMPENVTLDGTLYGLATEGEDLSATGESHLQFNVVDRAVAGNPGVSVFVAWDQRAAGLEPNWLRDTFTLTDHYVGVSEPAGQHRLWVREYVDGETVTLGGASAAGAGPFPADTKNYFVLFGDARTGLDSFYAMTAEGIRADGTWSIDFSLSDSAGHSQTVSATVADSLDGRNRFGLFARHPAPGSEASAPVWEIFDLSLRSAGTVDLAGFELWREQFFPGQLDDPAISGPTASPAGDGVQNLMKYALGLSPMVPVSSADLPLAEVNGEGQLVLVYWERTDVSDIEYIPEASTDLVGWSSGEPDVLELFRQTGVDPSLEEVGVIGGFSGDGSRGFLRLKVMLKE